MPISGEIMFKHILIPTDGSPVAAKAVKAGVALAKEIGAKITGYYALEPLRAHIYGEGYIIDRKMIAEFERGAREVADRHVAAIGRAAKAAGVQFKPLVTKAYAPHKGIITAAKKQKCDVIFMASHGRRGLTRLIMGSVTNKVLTQSKIPVLVYR
jgi:nucleotide-binding universal stress UspA family protein